MLMVDNILREAKDYKVILEGDIEEKEIFYADVQLTFQKIKFNFKTPVGINSINFVVNTFLIKRKILQKKPKLISIRIKKLIHLSYESY